MIVNPQVQSKGRSLIIFPGLVRGGLTLFLIVNLFALFLYALGTRQGFTDPTQWMLLRIAALTGLLLLIWGAYGLILDFRFLLKKRPFPLVRGLLVHGFLGAFGLFTAAASVFIMVFAQGNRG
jgi:hypothetical protein